MIERHLAYAAKRTGKSLSVGGAWIIAVASLLIAWPFIGGVHGYLFPQILDFTVQQVRTGETGQIEITGRFIEPRWAHCRLVEIDWYMGARGALTSPPRIVKFLDQGCESSPNDPSGFCESGWWRIGIPAEHWCRAQYATALHDCGLFWSQTPLYDKPNECKPAQE